MFALLHMYNTMFSLYIVKTTFDFISFNEQLMLASYKSDLISDV